MIFVVVVVVVVVVDNDNDNDNDNDEFGALTHSFNLTLQQTVTPWMRLPQRW